MISATPQRLYLIQLGTSTVARAGRTLEMVLGCYLVETSAGKHILIDSGFTPDRQAWPLDDNEEQLRASTRKLLDLVEREHVALVIFGHDGQQWQTLKKAPAYYA
jgi:hypothetical protein